MREIYCQHQAIKIDHNWTLYANCKGRASLKGIFEIAYSYQD